MFLFFGIYLVLQPFLLGYLSNITKNDTLELLTCLSFALTPLGLGLIFYPFLNCNN
jgi:hypothetical protein